MVLLCRHPLWSDWDNIGLYWKAKRRIRYWRYKFRRLDCKNILRFKCDVIGSESYEVVTIKMLVCDITRYRSTYEVELISWKELKKFCRVIIGDEYKRAAAFRIRISEY